MPLRAGPPLSAPLLKFPQRPLWCCHRECRRRCRAARPRSAGAGSWDPWRVPPASFSLSSAGCRQHQHEEALEDSLPDRGCRADIKAGIAGSSILSCSSRQCLHVNRPPHAVPEQGSCKKESLTWRPGTGRQDVLTTAVRTKKHTAAHARSVPAGPRAMHWSELGRGGGGGLSKQRYQCRQHMIGVIGDASALNC